MRAVVIDRYGGPEVLRIAEVPEPVVGPGQVRVRVRTAGVNPVDVKQRGGYFAAGAEALFPLRMGNEYAGTVDQVGDGVGEFAVGDEVLGSATGQCRRPPGGGGGPHSRQGRPAARVSTAGRRWVRRWCGAGRG